MKTLRSVLSLLMLMLGAVVASMFAIGEDTHLESDGKSVTLSLLYTVKAKQVAYVRGWLGITAQSGDSGDSRAITVDQREYQFTIPPALNPSIGDIVYIDVTDLTGHTPDSTAYSITPGANKVPLYKATSDVSADPDGDNDLQMGILLSQLNMIGIGESGL